MTSPYSRSKDHLEQDGWRVQKVEQWIPVPKHPAGGIRRDLFGFGDIFAIKRGHPPTIVQTTSAGNMNARLQKILTETRQDARLCVDVGVRVLIHGWRLGGPRGARKRWLVKIREVTAADFGEAANGSG